MFNLFHDLYEIFIVEKASECDMEKRFARAKLRFGGQVQGRFTKMLMILLHFPADL